MSRPNPKAQWFVYFLSYIIQRPHAAPIFKNLVLRAPEKLDSKEKLESIEAQLEEGINTVERMLKGQPPAIVTIMNFQHMGWSNPPQKGEEKEQDTHAEAEQKAEREQEREAPGRQDEGDQEGEAPRADEFERAQERRIERDSRIERITGPDRSE